MLGGRCRIDIVETQCHLMQAGQRGPRQLTEICLLRRTRISRLAKTARTASLKTVKCQQSLASSGVGIGDVGRS